MHSFNKVIRNCIIRTQKTYLLKRFILQALREAHSQFQESLSSAQADFEVLAALDQKIKSFNVGANPYTWFTMEALEDTWRNLQKIIQVMLMISFLKSVMIISFCQLKVFKF